MPLKNMLTPTSVPIAQTELIGQALPIIAASTSVTMPSTSNQPRIYSQLNGESGILGKLDDTVYFFSYTGSIVEITSYAGLTVLGQADLADTQQIMDKIHGGYAAVACSRAMEVQ